MFRDAALIAAKDLRLEWRSRVATNQVAPFALLVLVIFAFALDADRPTLARVTPGLFWVAVLFSGLLAIQRSFAVENADGVRDALRLSGLEPASIFLGKALACIDTLSSRPLSPTQRLRVHLDSPEHARLDVRDKQLLREVLAFFRGREGVL